GTPAHWAALRQCPRLFAPRADPDSSTSARSVGAPYPLYGPRGGVPGASGARCQWRSRLYLQPPVVGRDDGDSALPAGTPGEARGVDSLTTCPSGALWGLSGATQPLAWECYPHPAPAGGGRRGRAPAHPILALDQAPEARVCLGDGHVSI